MSKTVIAVSGSWVIDSGGPFPGYTKAYISNDYIRSISLANGLPIILPFVPGEQRSGDVEQWLEMADGLILSGGHDISPLFYGEQPLQKLGEVWPERDYFDAELLAKAQAMGKPVLGICRGFQLINAVRGGKLLQDLSYSKLPLLKHWQGHSPALATHAVNFVPGNAFYNLFGEEVLVNSHHHQVVIEAGADLIVAGRAPDGVIEAVEDPAKKLIAVQWHPEMMTINNQIMRDFFSYFVGLCEAAKN